MEGQLTTADNNRLELEQSYEKLVNNQNSILEQNENIQDKNFELSKIIKNQQFEKKNFSEMLIKIFKTKLATVKGEINSIKMFYANEANNLKNEYTKIVEKLSEKITLLKKSFTKDLEQAKKQNREVVEKEFEEIAEVKERKKEQEIIRVSQKYEKHLLEQIRVNEKLEKEIKILVKYFL